MIFCMSSASNPSSKCNSEVKSDVTNFCFIFSLSIDLLFALFSNAMTVIMGIIENIVRIMRICSKE